MGKYVKPTLKTKFHIDFGWWENSNFNLRHYLLEHLCDACRDLIETDTSLKTMDWVDPQSAQVFTIDQVWHVVYSHCRHDPDYVFENLPLTSAIFRLFVSNNNTPLTPVEMQQHLRGKSAGTILRTIGAHKTYRGIRPVSPSVIG